MLKPMGLILAPLAFALIICVVALQIVNISVGDIVGYGSVLLMKPAPMDTSDVTDFLAPAETGKGTQDTVNIVDVTFPTYEKVYGEISIESANILCPLVYGDSERALSRGAGQYIGSMIIGYPGTTLVCAHVNRQFKNLHKVQVGDMIQVRTSYGVYTYEVKYTGVHEADDDSAYDLAREDENLVLYTCYYQYTSLGNWKKRFYVCADYVSGPMILDWGGVQ
jgi:sortase A